jgi:YlmC/YmxH family sporulation protein
LLRLSDIREKEVINVYNGERLGYVYDFEMDIEKGTLTSIIMPGAGKVMGLFSKPNDIEIEWKRIIKIGLDTILVNLKDNE